MGFGVTRPTGPPRQLVGGTTKFGYDFRPAALFFSTTLITIFPESLQKNNLGHHPPVTYTLSDRYMKDPKGTKSPGYWLRPATRSSADRFNSIGYGLEPRTRWGTNLVVVSGTKIRVTLVGENLGTLINIRITVKWMFVEFEVRASDILDWSLVSSLFPFFHGESCEQLIVAMLVLLGPQLK